MPSPLVILALAASLSGPAAVIDGDTLTVAGTRVRLWAIDAAERGEPGHGLAADALARLIGQQNVTCWPIEIDRYGRTVATCTNAGGLDLAEAMLAQGHAVLVRRFLAQHPAGAKRLLAIERQRRRLGQNLRP